VWGRREEENEEGAGEWRRERKSQVSMNAQIGMESERGTDWGLLRDIYISWEDVDSLWQNAMSVQVLFHNMDNIVVK